MSEKISLRDDIYKVLDKKRAELSKKTEIEDPSFSDVMVYLLSNQKG